MISLTQSLLRALQKLARSKREPEHLRLGRCGETEAYFYLRRLGYRMVASNFRVAYGRGEIDLIGWDQDILCFIEVKTRLDDSFAPPSTAVGKSKQKHIREVAKAYLRRLPRNVRPSCRFDVVSVVPSEDEAAPQITLRKAAFSWSSSRRREPGLRESFSERFRRDTRHVPHFR